jgi:hypothetical protein
MQRSGCTIHPDGSALMLTVEMKALLSGFVPRWSASIKLLHQRTCLCPATAREGMACSQHLHETIDPLLMVAVSFGGHMQG